MVIAIELRCNPVLELLLTFNKHTTKRPDSDAGWNRDVYAGYSVPHRIFWRQTGIPAAGFLSTTNFIDIMPHPRLPAELLDDVVDLLHDTSDALKSCCLVSKSWIQRTRKHIFFHVKFVDPQDLDTWKTMFPDPSASPARYTKNLVVWSTVTAVDAEERGWLLAFSRVEHLEVDFYEPNTSLLSFHGFSPALKTLRLAYVDFPFSQILSFIHSFPFIENLFLAAWSNGPIEGIDGQPAAIQPPLTGCLGLAAQDGMTPIVSRLFPTQNSLHLRELDLELICEEDVFATSALVERCRFTLESLKVGVGSCGMSV